jgi:putative aminopeptidase FrvX
MKEKILDYLQKVINIPSPTGFTHFLKDFLIQNAVDKGIDYSLTRKGAVSYYFKGNNNLTKTMLAVHMDTLGAMVKEVNTDGLKLTPIGGYPLIYIIGNYCTIHGENNQKYRGTILPDNPAAHANNKLNEIKLSFDNITVRADITPEKNKSLEDFISVGNFVSFDPQLEMINGFIKTRHLDDKASGAVLLYLADLLVERKIESKEDLVFFFNFSEETGQGLAGFSEVDNLIIVDMGVVGHGCAGDEFSVSICSKDSSGPYNYELTQKLLQLSREHRIDFKMDVFPFYSSDGSKVLAACHDIRVALIGPGVSASHGYERTHIKALENTCQLLQSYING